MAGNVNDWQRDWFLEISRPFEQVVAAGHAPARQGWKEIEGIGKGTIANPSLKLIVLRGRHPAPCVLFMSDHPASSNDRTADRP